MTVRILIGDVRARLRDLPAASVDCVVTSPPYWGLRSYLAPDDPDKPREIGLERTLGEHLDVLVQVFREVRRVLKPQGTCWINYGDCYAADANGRPADQVVGDDRTFRDKPFSTVGPIYPIDRGKRTAARWGGGNARASGTLKPKDLCMVANRLAIALQDDGWWVRSEIVWHKPNPMPESSRDRPTTAHEKVWLLSKSENYYYDAEALREPVTGGAHRRRKPGPNSRKNVDQVPRARKVKVPGGWDTMPGGHGTINRAGRTEATYVQGKTVRHVRGIKNNESFLAAIGDLVETRNVRNVWTIAPAPFRDAHFATFPPELARRCVVAGTPALLCGLCGEARPDEGCGGMCPTGGPGVVLDPFGGAGTVGMVAERLGRDSIIIELNPEYAAMARRRILGDASGRGADVRIEGLTTKGEGDDETRPSESAAARARAGGDQGAE